MFNSTRFVVFAFVVALAMKPAAAQETQPGDVCTTAGEFARSGGVEIPGGHIMVCDGSNWLSLLDYNDSGRTLSQIDYDSGTCTAIKQGRLRYTSATNLWEYCDDLSWQSLVSGGAGLWTAGAGDDIYYNSGTPRVGIGDATPDAALDVVGDIHYTGVTTDVSDIRLKENIHRLDNPLKKLTSLEGFSFEMKGDPKHRVEYGVSAQAVREVFPELVHEIDENGTLGVSYKGFIAPMIEAMKEQQVMIVEQRGRIDTLSAQNAALQSRLKTIERNYLSSDTELAPPASQDQESRGY